MAASDTTPRGLSAAQAAARLAQDGPNQLTPPRPRTLWHMLAELVREPMLQLMLAAGLIYLLLGDRREALMLLAFVVLMVVISLVQEQRTERVLEALRDLTSPRALVLRDGAPQRIAGTAVVRGDVLVLAEGDRIAADARLLEAYDLQADESLLSGESLPVLKARGEAVLAGSMVVGGQGLAEVTAIGAASEIGHIGSALAEIASPDSPLRSQTRRLVRVFALLGLTLSAGLVLLYGLARGDWLAAVLAGISLAMSMLPQEFLLILTVFMAMGAWRLSRQRVLTRRAATIETLGSATVLCTDKTGTLTLNQMAVAELQPWGQVLPAELLEFAVLASEREPFDAMERALLERARGQQPPVPLHPGWRLVHEYGLSSSLPAMTHVWHDEVGAAVVAVKGAPEAVLSLARLPAAQAEALAAQAQAMAARGLRVLAVARAGWQGQEDWPAAPDGFAWQLLGLVAFADPLRPEVPAAIEECRAAGLRVLMITGDHAETARAIAAQAGLAATAGVLTGPELAEMGEAQLRAAVRSHQVFARIRPEQKLRIVAALKDQGEVVAMTGDGVNDAPSLKAAHIGIAMGGRGTDVAREAAALVLLDDNFASIVQAVRLGRRIFDNLRKAMAFVLAVHVPIAGLSLLPLLLGWPVLLGPVHIAFLELLIDPVCSVVFEAEREEGDVMRRPPRDPQAPLFSAGLMAWSAAQGLLVLLAVAGLFGWLLAQQFSPEQARSLAFVALVACNIGLILANRNLRSSLLQAWLRPNAMLWSMLLATAALLAATLGLAPLREVFRFATMPPPQLLAALGLGLLVWLLLEAMKALARRRL
ncbi:cation-translocating P-type ATPase [Paucibacter sediminis]|uniref:Cation-translocating P-type ATPase n=1 Tax=Paucibacter sediminis TaxID=3019553 RepID=A0AA95NH29_9BURK|nr:cation-translocating P-type ATPase [Paucibacter sp. S2-9]WIT13438.1 cation-translocating P-type ATPase [Paucibacter sp. S2-9]